MQTTSIRLAKALVAAICVALLSTTVSFGESIDQLEAQAKAGDLSAKHTVGVWYFGLAAKYGENTNKAKGLRYLREAAKAGFAESQYSLGVISNASGDMNEAKSWFAKAAAQGHERAKKALENVTEEMARLQRIRETGVIRNDDYEYFEQDTFYKQVEALPSFSADNKDELKRLYRNAKKAGVRKIFVMKCGPSCDRLSVTRIVVWNQAAKSIYGVSRPRDYASLDLALKGKDVLNKMLRESGVEEGYKDGVLYEMWKDIETQVLAIDVLQVAK